MFTITVAGETLAELGAKLLAAADALSDGPAGEQVEASIKPKPAAVKDKPKPEPEVEEGGLVYDDDVKPHVIKLSKVHGRDAAVDILAGFETVDGEPCESAKTVQPGDWAALLKKIKARQAKLDKEKAAADED